MRRDNVRLRIAKVKPDSAAADIRPMTKADFERAVRTAKAIILLDRILSRCVLGATQHNGTSCWLFLGFHCNKGYAEVKVEGVARRVHRVLWELAHDRKIGEGMTLDHLCTNTRCINPDHLEEVTRPVNTARGNRNRKRRRT